MPPLVSPAVAEQRDSLPPKEDSETDVSDDGMDISPTAKKAPEIGETSTPTRAAGRGEADDAAPESSPSKEMPTEVRCLTVKPNEGR